MWIDKKEINIPENPIFEITKQDILGWKLEPFTNLWLRKYIYEAKILHSMKETELRKDLEKQFFKILTRWNIYPDNLDKIQNIQFFENWKVFVFLENNKKLAFNLEKQNIYSWDEEQVKENREKENKKSVKLLEKSSKTLDAIKSIFENNNNEKNVFKWDIWEINSEDVVNDSINFWPEFFWKDLKELQTIFNKSFDVVRKIDIENLSEKNREELLKQEKEYLEIFMWIGNKYEWAAPYLQETFTDYWNIADDIVNLSSDKQALDYLLEIHRKIDNNDYQSENVEASYKVVITILHQKIFDKLVKNDASDEYFLRYAKIVTGRDNQEDELLGFDANFNNDNIDDNLRDQEKANEAILYIVNKKWWVLDKLGKSDNFSVEDKEVKDKNPFTIISDFRKIFYEKFPKTGLAKAFENNLASSWYEDVLKLKKETKYDDLNVAQKTKISVLYRVSKKLNDWKSWGEELMSFENPFDNKNWYILAEFASLFESVANDYREETSEKLEEIFDEDDISSKDFWFWKKSENLSFTDKKVFDLSWTDKEVFDLFQDINWNWIFDLGDSSIELWKIAWKMWAMIWVGIWTMALIPWVLAWSAAAWLTATLTWIALNPKWYDTFWEAFYDISTDIRNWVFFWMLWWWMSAQIEWKIWTALLKKWKIIKYTKKVASLKQSGLWKTNLKVMVSDLALLWVLPEIQRQKMLREKYWEKEFLFDRKEKPELTKEIHPDFWEEKEENLVEIKPLYSNQEKKPEIIDKVEVEKKIKITKKFIEKLEEIWGYENKIKELKIKLEVLNKKLKN